MAGELDFLAVNGYEKLSQPDGVSDEVMNEAWKKAANGVPDDQIMKETFDAREMVHSEYWRKIMSVPKEE